ncbi:recombinase family protein [Thermomonospora umbrina]|uniref:Recombinase n=1 Tax=Thermomonospora umbrina TaxID=111806 RepID=A0A3D9SWB2_9ACTN|nr:recombinase family protein [Thermomonospora umbrina]REF00233.1 recombinase [Thermomonospora umbrina]
MAEPSTPPVEYARDCILYLRKSKGTAGISRQRRDSEALAARLRWRIVGECVDTDATAFVKIGSDVSALRTRRDDYQRLLTLLRTDQRETPLGVMAWHIDRVLRDPPEAEEFIRVCAPGMHPVETVRSGNYELWTPTGRKRLRNDVADSTYEVDHLIERLESDRDEKSRQGRWHGGPVPFGWKLQRLSLDDDEKSLVLDPVPAEAIRWAHMEVLRGLKNNETSLGEIAREWDRRGLRRRKGGRFVGGEVRRILLRSRNAGLVTRHGDVIETELEGGVADWPPIVEERVWRAVAEILLEPGRGPSNSRKRKWLGSNLYVCGVCGTTMRTGMGSGGTAEHRRAVVTYRCRSGGKGHAARNAAMLDEYVTALLKSRLARPDLMQLLAAEQPEDVEDIETRLAVEKSELLTWRRLARERKVSVLAFAENETACLARIETIKAELVAAVRTPLMVELLDVEDVGAEWDGQTLAWRRLVLQRLVTIHVHPARRGRPPMWRPGESYFNPEGIEPEWHVGGRTSSAQTGSSGARATGDGSGEGSSGG